MSLQLQHYFTMPFNGLEELDKKSFLIPGHKWEHQENVKSHGEIILATVYSPGLDALYIPRSVIFSA